MIQRKWQWLCVAAVLSLAVTVYAQDDEDGEGGQPTSAPTDYSAISKALAPSLAKVEITLQYDKGDAPEAGGESRYMLAELVSEERPLELGGFVLADNQVIVYDPLIHPRFIKEIQVLFGDQAVKAKIAGYARDQSALLLELDKPLKGAVPLKFTPEKGSLMTVSYSRDDIAEWSIRVSPMYKSYAKNEGAGRQYFSIARGGGFLAVTDKGKPVAVCMKNQIPVDESWKISPLKWSWISAKEMEKIVSDLRTKCDSGLLRVALSFRSPKKSPGRRFGMGGEVGETEQSVEGVLLDDKTVVVLANLPRQVTARLERIRVYGAKGEPVTARFACTLSDYGCFLAALDKPMPMAFAVSQAKLQDLPFVLLPEAKFSLQGENRVAYYNYDRIGSLSLAWKRVAYPTLLGGAEKMFVFDPKGDLLAMPLMHRGKPGTEDESRLMTTPLAYLVEARKDLAKNTDQYNIPLTEEEESRVAWTGMMLQPLNTELARENGVSEQTQDGQTGALVSYVFPNSPASKAGIKPGAILLRVQMDDQAKPVEVRVEGYEPFGGRPFPWEMLDRLPESMYDDCPTPWPPAEDTLSRVLTDFGFGKKGTAEFFIDGKVQKVPFVVEKGPLNYECAPKYKSARLGITVRDLTYELDRYFKRKPGEPGVIISKMEPGSKTSVAGMKPFEIITHIDGKPVLNVKDFETLLPAKGSVKLSVKRMNKGRQVTITLESSTKPTTATAASGPATSTAPADDEE